MPTQENLEGLRSGNVAKAENRSGMLAKEALAAEKPSMTDTPESMTKDEALAIAWTGLEALALTKQANLFHSPRTGRVVIELLDTEYTIANGLRSIGK